MSIANLLRNEIYVQCKKAYEMGHYVVEFKTSWVARKFALLDIPMKAINVSWRDIVDGICVKRKKKGVIVVDCRCFAPYFTPSVPLRL